MNRQNKRVVALNRSNRIKNLECCKYALDNMESEKQKESIKKIGFNLSFLYLLRGV